VSCGLRRGAWYRVVGLTPEDAVLQCRGASGPGPTAVPADPLHPAAPLDRRPRLPTFKTTPITALALRRLPGVPRPRAITGYTVDMQCAKVQRQFGIAWMSVPGGGVRR